MTVRRWADQLEIKKDPDAEKVYTIDGGELLAAGAEFDDWDFIIALIAGDADPLEIDNDSLVPSPTTGAANQAVKFRMTGGTPGLKYLVTFRYVTNETPPQTDDHSFRVPIAEQ